MRFYETLSSKVPLKVFWVPNPLPGVRWQTIKGKKEIFELKKMHDGSWAYVMKPS